MRKLLHCAMLLFLLAAGAGSRAQKPTEFRGFDRNVYPGDQLLPALRKNFQFTGYWLNNPPGETTNSWTGKRTILKQNGFGFLVLFRGRTDADLNGKNAAALGDADGKAAVAAAAREGFPANVVIFLDQEEGGRLLAEQADYLFAWVDAVGAAGARAGIYCSAIPVPDGAGDKTITTAQDIVAREAARAEQAHKSGKAVPQLDMWIANDACPPSPGCSVGNGPLSKPDINAAVWQYAQSPRRAQFSSGCPQNQASDGMCYAPGIPHSGRTFIDLDVAGSADPSEEP